MKDGSENGWNVVARPCPTAHPGFSWLLDRLINSKLYCPDENLDTRMAVCETAYKPGATILLQESRRPQRRKTSAALPSPRAGGRSSLRGQGAASPKQCRVQSHQHRKGTTCLTSSRVWGRHAAAKDVKAFQDSARMQPPRTPSSWYLLAPCF